MGSYYAMTLFQYTVSLRKPEVGNFASIIKTAIPLIETTFKRIIKHVAKCIFVFISRFDENCQCLIKTVDASRPQGVPHMIYMFFIFSLAKV